MLTLPLGSVVHCGRIKVVAIRDTHVVESDFHRAIKFSSREWISQGFPEKQTDQMWTIYREYF